MNENSGGAPVRVQVTGGVATITLDSPPVNALTRPVIHGLERALDESTGARAVVVESAVEGIFAAGADLELMRTADVDGFLGYLDELRAVVERVANLPVPVVAVIDGHALGGGLELALACTLRIASARARLGVPEIRLGLVPGAGGTQRLPRVVGPALAADLVLTGRALDGAAAGACGLVGRVCDPGELDAVVTATVDGLAQASGPALQGALRCLRAADDPGGDAGAAVERDVIAELFGGVDAREGIAAFHERRPPVFADTRTEPDKTTPARAGDASGGLSTASA